MDDAPIAGSWLEKFAIWLFATPWWVPGLLAFTATITSIWMLRCGIRENPQKFKCADRMVMARLKLEENPEFRWIKLDSKNIDYFEVTQEGLMCAYFNSEIDPHSLTAKIAGDDDREVLIVDSNKNKACFHFNGHMSMKRLIMLQYPSEYDAYLDIIFECKSI